MFKKALSVLGMVAGITALTGSALAQSDVQGDLRVLIIGGEAQLNIVNEAVGRFNADYPNVKVQVDLDNVPAGWGDFASRVMAQFQANNAYDIYNTAIETFRIFQTSGLFLPLEDHIASNPDYQSFDKALFDHATYDGHVYFVPVGWNNIMVNYNRDLFDAAGVAYPGDDWTWEQFRETALALTKRDQDGNAISFGYEVPAGYFLLMPWFFSNGTSPLTADWTASNMLDPKVAETLQFLYNLVHEDRVSPIPSAEGMDAQFEAGQVAMISRGRWILPSIERAGLNMDIAIPPSKEKKATVIGFGGYAVAKTSKYPELAEALLPYLSSLETQTGMSNGMPGRRDAAEKPDILDFPPSAALYYKSLPYTLPVPSPANFQEIEQIVMRYYAAIMADEVSIDDAVRAADQEITDSFARLAQK